MNVMEDIIVVIDDEPRILDAVTDTLKELKIRVLTFTSALKALVILKKNANYLFIVDYRMPKMSGLDFLVECKKKQISFKAILLTAFAEKDILENAINQNLLNKIVEKPFRNADLVEIVQELLKEKSDMVIKRELKVLSEENSIFKNVIGLDGGLIDVFKNIKVIAPIDYNVLITGESGTGKEIIADLIHNMSPRKHYSLIKINCAAFPDTLIDSELFGYVKGAFTGADKTKPGAIERADNGTLFLDEIGDLKPELQAKLLRVIEYKMMTPLGGQEKKVNFRLIAATNRNIETSNEFRSELFHRLNFISIHVPSLRERKEDINKLADYFVKTTCKEMGIPAYQKLDKEAITFLEQYSWLGNIRELKGVIIRAIVAAQTYNSKIIDTEILKLALVLPKNNTFKNVDRAINEIALDAVEKKIHIKDISKKIFRAVANYLDNDIEKIMVNTGLSKSSVYRILNEKD